jgi:hypothetical protein
VLRRVQRSRHPRSIAEFHLEPDQFAPPSHEEVQLALSLAISVPVAIETFTPGLWSDLARRQARERGSGTRRGLSGPVPGSRGELLLQRL